jgi:hypothetical protein
MQYGGHESSGNPLGSGSGQSCSGSSCGTLVASFVTYAKNNAERWSCEVAGGGWVWWVGLGWFRWVLGLLVSKSGSLVPNFLGKFQRRLDWRENLAFGWVGGVDVIF